MIAMRGLRSTSFGVGGIVVSLLLPGGASATDITFGGLTGFHVPFTTYTESGFTATVTGGIWGQGQAEGNPAPSIFTGTGAFGSASNTIVLTDGGSQFAFNGLDLAANFSTASYEFLGTRGGLTVFDLTGTQSNMTSFGNFQMVGGGVSLDPIDTLWVTINDSLDTANIDNIVFGPVPAAPEPSTWAMMLLGFVGLAFTFRQSRRKVSFA
jgi:PEP-CTERM motif